MTSDHLKMGQDRGNRQLWVEWWSLFLVLKWSQVAKSRFSKFRRSATMLKFRESWFRDFNRFKTKNKHHHSTQRGRLPLSWPILRWSEVIWSISGALGKIHIASERNKSATLALHRSKENNFLYRMDRLKIIIEWKIVSKYRSHHFGKSQISAF
jgi:hypothetical protein